MEQPDQRLYFWLQQAAQRLRNTADRRCMAAGGVTAPQMGALFAIHDAPGCTQQTLARALGQREPAVTAMVKRLLAADLVKREPSTKEHRAYTLQLTPHGQDTLGRLRPVVAAFNGEVAEAIAPETLSSVTLTLIRLADMNPDS